MKSQSKCGKLSGLYEDMFTKMDLYYQVRSERGRQNDRMNRVGSPARQATMRHDSRTTHHKKSGDRDHTGPSYGDIQEEYFYARHVLLMAIQKAEDEDMDAISRKMAYLETLVRAGAVRPHTRVDEILYYEDGYQVHVFYGGGELRWNRGTKSPDGIGHGHSVLEARYDGTYECVFQRKPE